MSNVNIFEQASRSKLRFETPKGYLSVEDLWDLPLQSRTGKANLDEIAQDLFRSLKDTSTISFVDANPNKGNEKLQLQFDIVKTVIDVKIAERDAEKLREANAVKKQKLLAILENKQNEALSNKSIEELRAEIDSMA